MATRNLTARFRRARSAAVRTAGPGPAAPAYDTSALVGDEPAYVHEVQAINEAVEEIDRNSEAFRACSCAAAGPAPPSRPHRVWGRACALATVAPPLTPAAQWRRSRGCTRSG